MSTLSFKLLAHQYRYVKKFLQDSSIWALLFIGGFGSGKSYTLSVTAVTLLLGFPGKNIGVYSVTYDLLKLVNIIQICARLDELGLKYRLNKADMIITVHGYGQIIFRSLDNPQRIIGYEHAFALIDELDTLSEKKASEAWNQVTARNRQKIYGFRNKIGVFTTPEGFKFCYKRWEKEIVEGYSLVRAKTRENTFLPDEYIGNLKATYPANLIEAYLEGMFVNLNGDAVYYAFDRFEHHSSETLETLESDTNWEDIQYAV